MHPYNYSDKELELFSHFDIDDILLNPSAPPVLIYATVLPYRALMDYDRIDTRVIDSLRRCIKAIEKSNPSRETKEFDDLIRI